MHLTLLLLYMELMKENAAIQKLNYLLPMQ